jgi:ABC-2 type transport system permease protein
MKPFLAIIAREIKNIFSNRLNMAIMLVFPIAYFLLLGGIYSAGYLEKMPVAVIDNDNTKISRNIIRFFNASPDMQVRYRISNVEELKNLFILQKAVLGVYIPRGTQKNIKRQKPQNITVFVNASNYITASITDIDANTIISTLSGGIKYKTLMKKGFSVKQAQDLLIPVKNDSSKLFNPALNYSIFLTPGIWMAFMQQLLLLFGMFTISAEFDLKTVPKMLETSKSLFGAIAGKLAAYMLFAALLFAILYFIVFPVFSVHVEGAFSAVFVLSAAFAFASISLGMVLSAVLKTRANALKGCLVITAPAFLLSGYTWPLDQIPAFLRALVQAIPLTTFLDGFRKIYIQAQGLDAAMKFAPRLVLLGCVFFLLAYIFTKLRVKKALINV